MKNERYFRVCLALMLLGNRLAYGGGRLLGQGRFHHDLTSSVDALIPVLSWTVSVYFGCFLFWVLLYRRVSMLPREHSDRFFCANLLAKGFCFLLFVLLPTTNVRPALPGTTVWDALMRFLYRIDDADNLFPSIHCMISWLCWVGVRRNRDVPVAWRASALVMAIAVCLSTLTTRQHVLADVVGGILLSECCYRFAGSERLRRGYAALADGVIFRINCMKGVLRHDEQT